ncbi:MAG: DUF3618 domain-containing protein [Henriciella sp.]|uniref:DUF3618 domain-containing protein n=1 Tax=Henriciella sp. TaxID=1968823 RepID=UPI003C76B846
MSKSPEQLEKEIKEERAQADANLEELEERLSPGQILDDFLKSAGDGPKKFVGELAAQVRDNPVPTAVTAAGMAWLAAASQSSKSHKRAADVPAAKRWTPEDHATLNRYNRIGALELQNRRFADESDDAFARRRYYAQAGILEIENEDGEDFEAFKERVDEAAHKTKEAAGDLLNRIEEAGEAAASTIASAGQGVADAAASAAHGVAGAARTAAGSAQHAASGAGHAAANAGRGIAGGMSSLGDTASDAAARARQFERENPLIAGALAFAGGALLGGLVPNTRAENEMAGPQADKLRGDAKERASAAAHEALDEARDTVRSVDGDAGNRLHH